MYSAVAKQQESRGAREKGRKHTLPCSLAPLLLCLFLLIGCASVDPVVKVGLVGPFEGADRAIGYDVIYSARLAVREINAAGGIGGYRVALVALDDSGDPQLARDVAASLVIDPAVVAVMGHWTPQTTAVAAPLYAAANLPFIPAGEPPFGRFAPDQLSERFRADYKDVAPFDEAAGWYAGTAYDGFQLLWQALTVAAEEENMSRTAVSNALHGLSVAGMTGILSVTP